MKHEKIFSPFYETFLRLCKENSLSPSAAARKAGISSGAPTAWKNYGAIPKPAQRAKLCDLFGVTDEVLLGYENPNEQKNTAPTSGSGPANYELLTKENKAKAEEYIQLLLNSQS